MLLTYPIWLFALAAISIPVIIHLWNIKPGKTLKVGSIALFTASSPASSRSFKLLDILLLLLRCLLLLLLAFLLATPLLSQHLKTNNIRGWVLLPQASLKETYNRFRHKIDSLANAGYELHAFEPGFSKMEFSNLEVQADSVEPNDSLNYWALVNQLSNKVSAGTAIELFTPNSIKNFKGEKPTTSLRLKWHTYTSADSVVSWPAAAWLTDNGNIRVLQGLSSPTATVYKYQDIVNGQSPEYKVSVSNGLPYISFKKETIPVDTSINRVAIYADRLILDVNYLKAALLAVGKLIGRNTVIKLYNNAAMIPADQAWIYWLSEKPAQASIRSKTKNLFLYKPGKSVKTNTWLNYRDAHTLAQGEAKIALYQTVPAKKEQDNSVWVDGFDSPILTLEQSATLNIYHFYSRFNPAWTDLVWQDDFPKWLLELTQSIEINIGKYERRTLSHTQLQPNFVADNINNDPNSYKGITFYLWLALVITFAAERWLATNNRRELVNG